MNGLADEFEGEVAVVRLNADAPDVVWLQESYGGRGHPLFVLFYERGQVTGPFLGPQR